MTNSPRLSSLLGSLLLLAGLGACSNAPSDGADCEGARCDVDSAELGLCAAVRGNGQLITAHFGALARIIEHYGPIDGASGGSSGSITIFMTESMQANPAISDCGDAACSQDELNARTALLFKSFPGYVQHLASTEEAAAVGNLVPLVTAVQESGVEALLDQDVEAGVDALIDLLESDDLRDLVNPELIGLLQTSPNPEFHARDILEGVQKLGAFEADSDKIFIRPGLLSFEGLADKLGRVADFYAGYGPADHEAMKGFMDACALPGAEKSWFEVAALPAGESTCGALFDDMLGSYRAALASGESSYTSRIDEPVGERLAALISTSVLTGTTAKSWSQARADYNAAQEYSFEANFDDVQFGYFGKADDLARVAANEEGYEDLKSAKLMDLGEVSWRTALSYSPAEPGLARALELDADNVSAGGWSDLHPVLVLKNLGCEQVVYVTRTGDESGFAEGVAGLLGMDAEARKELYDLDAASAYDLSIAEADATWCTDWNNQDATDLLGITLDAYNAPVESTSAFFTESERSYRGLVEETGLRGCTPGAAAPDAE